MSSTTFKPATTVEAKVTSKGQVTLPKELRKRLGVQRGSRIRFSIPVSGAVHVEPSYMTSKTFGEWPIRAVNPEAS